MYLTLLLITISVFLVVGLLLGILSLIIKDKLKRRELWVVYWIEFLTLGAILIPAYFGEYVFTAVIGVLAIISLTEYLNLPKDKLPLFVKAVCLAMSAFIFIMTQFYDFWISYASIPLAAMILLIASIFSKNHKNFLPNITYGLLGLIYVSVFFSHLIFIRKLENGFLYVFFMYGVSEINDSFALIFGKSFGKKKIFPHISPNKTYVGFFSGILFALVFAVILNIFITRFKIIDMFLLCLIVIIFTLLGDIVSSKIKRAQNVKDFSRTIPGVGGVLDAYDALIFVSPVFFYFLKGVVKSSGLG